MEIKHTVRASGDPDIDWRNLEAARQDLTSRGGGFLGLDGMVKLKDIYRIGNVPICPVGVGPDSGLDLCSNRAQWSYGNWYDPMRDPSAVPFSGIDARGYDFESPNLALRPGDHFAIWSNDPIPGVPPHLTRQCPMEIHTVKELRNNRVLFDDIVADRMLDGPKIVRLNMINNVRMERLRIRYSGIGENTRGFDFRSIKNLAIEDVVVEHSGPGPAVFNTILNGRADNFSCEGKHNYDTSYGYHIVLGVVNGFVFRDSIVRGTRHPFTTGGFSTQGGTRWGTPRNWSVINVISAQNGTSRSGLSAFDTHAEGCGGRFVDCRAIVPADALNRGFYIRSRRTHLINCSVDGGGGAITGISLVSSDGLIHGGMVDNCWRGIVVENFGITPERNIIRDTTVLNCSGAGFLVEDCRDLLLYNNVTGNCGWRLGITPRMPQAIVAINGGEQIRLERNSLNRRENRYSVHMDPQRVPNVHTTGNICRGYGPGDDGITPMRVADNYRDART